MVPGQTDMHRQSDGAGRPPHTAWRTDSADEMPEVRTRTLKLVEENTGVNFCDFGLGNSFLGMTTKTQQQNKKLIGLDHNLKLL